MVRYFKHQKMRNLKWIIKPTLGVKVITSLQFFSVSDVQGNTLGYTKQNSVVETQPVNKKIISERILCARPPTCHGLCTYGWLLSTPLPPWSGTLPPRTWTQPPTPAASKFTANISIDCPDGTSQSCCQ